MPRFNVRISGEDLDRANTVLNAAGIGTVASTEAFWEGQEPPKGLAGLTAVVDAPAEEIAEANVRKALPKDGDYKLSVEPAE